MDKYASVTKSISLADYGIENAIEIYHNPTYDFLFQEELNDQLVGFEKGQLTELGAVNVMTGIFTGRSPKDKYIVKDAITEDTFGGRQKKHPTTINPFRKPLGLL